MKQNISVKVIFISFTVLLILACSFLSSGGGTATPAPTDLPPTAAATNTSAPTNTPLPPPTETEIPATPTPAPVGEAVRSPSYEVTVMDARSLTRVYMGNYYYYPKAGQLFVEVVVKVSNLTGSTASVPWQNVYMVESTGDVWYANWSGFTATNTGKKVDGSTISVNDTLDGKGTIDFDQDVFLRAIWFVSKQTGKTTLLFGFDDSPNIEIVIQ